MVAFIFKLFVIFSSSMCFAATSKKIVVLGDSLAAGYGVAKEQAFPSILEKKLQQKGYAVQVVNAGISGSTSASAVSRLQWLLKSKPDVLLLELGGNDGLRGLKLSQTQSNMQSTIDLALNNKVKVILAGMKLPLDYGVEYRKEVEALFLKLSQQNKILYIPFLLDGVGGEKDLNQPDGIHPNEKGHIKIADHILPVVEKSLNQ